MRPRTSPVWKMPREEFFALVQNNTEGTKGALAVFGLRNAGSNYRTLKARILHEGIDWNALSEKWRKQSLFRVQQSGRKSTAEILTENSSYNRNRLKKRLIGEGLLDNQCSRCGRGPEWFGEPLVLILDHVNGVYNDCRRENLRLVCPNCNSQLPTFCGRQNKGKRTAEKKTCTDCGASVARYSLRCRKCAHQVKRKSQRPSLEILKLEVDALGWEATGRKYGVSGNAIKKWFRG